MCSAGLPQQGVPAGRERSSLYLLRVTDERVPDTDKKFFTFPLSIHGIERAGAEAGVRAAEDLATWAACEAGTATAPVTLRQGRHAAAPAARDDAAARASPRATRCAAPPSTSSSRTRTAGSAATSTTASASSSATTATAST